MSLSVTICNELLKLEKWFALNKLLLNISKTNYMIFCKSEVEQNIQISFGNKLINKVNETKFLGVIIDEKVVKGLKSCRMTRPKIKLWQRWYLYYFTEKDNTRN